MGDFHKVIFCNFNYSDIILLKTDLYKNNKVLCKLLIEKLKNEGKFKEIVIEFYPKMKPINFFTYKYNSYILVIEPITFDLKFSSILKVCNKNKKIIKFVLKSSEKNKNIIFFTSFKEYSKYITLEIM